MFTRLAIPETVRDALVDQARAALPNECCGVLAGRVLDGTAHAKQWFAVRNDAASPVEYLTNPRDLLDATKAARAAGLELIAVYHSHPTSAAVPSRTDVRNNTWGETAPHVIIGNVTTTAELRAWWLTERGFEECPIV